MTEKLEWWETEEGIEQMKAQEQAKFDEWLDTTPMTKRTKMNLGRSFSWPDEDISNTDLN